MIGSSCWTPKKGRANGDGKSLSKSSTVVSSVSRPDLARARHGVSLRLVHVRCTSDGCRLAAPPKSAEWLGQRIVVENVSGAAGTIALGRLARAAADGYTICIGDWATNVASGAIYPLQFDLLKDFEGVSLLTRSPQLILSKKANLLELINWLKANPDKAAAGIAGGALTTFRPSCFRNLLAPVFSSFPIAPVPPPCRTSWQAKSMLNLTAHLPRSRRCVPGAYHRRVDRRYSGHKANCGFMRRTNDVCRRAESSRHLSEPAFPG
jgi:Tripartite tricarboxylate transporter family receptor